MATISRAVGRGVANPNRDDVKLVQQLLNQHRKPPLRQIAVNGSPDQETIAAIEEFQARVVKMARPDGRVDPNGATLRKLSEGGRSAAASTAPGSGYFSHPDAAKVTLAYGANAVKMNREAEHLLKSILAACGMTKGTLNSTLRTYHDQARITITQTYKRDPSAVSTWYGADVLKACKEHLDDIDGFAAWWKEHDRKRGKVSSKHLSNRAMDVVPEGDRLKFVAKVRELKKVPRSGVAHIIPKGEMKEPVDHVEFSFDIT